MMEEFEFYIETWFYHVKYHLLDNFKWNIKTKPTHKKTE